MNFSFDVGRRCIEQGLMPHCISTDLTVPGRLNTVHSMTEIMTRFLGLGFTLPQVVTMSHRESGQGARARRPGSGSLAVGRQADISVLNLQEGDWVVYDILGSGLRVNRAFTPHLTVKRGQRVHAGLRAAPVGLAAGSRGGGRLLLAAPSPRSGDKALDGEHDLRAARRGRPRVLQYVAPRRRADGVCIGKSTLDRFSVRGIQRIRRWLRRPSAGARRDLKRRSTVRSKKRAPVV